MNACGFFVERRFGIELNINPVEMALVEFPPLDGTPPANGSDVRGFDGASRVPGVAASGGERGEAPVASGN
jgi:hypothetical protein